MPRRLVAGRGRRSIAAPVLFAGKSVGEEGIFLSVGMAKLCLFEDIMWYVIQVRTGNEEKIRIQCEKLIDRAVLRRCFLPYYESMRRYQGSWHKEQKILFPGYVFLVSEKPERLFLELKRVVGLAKMLGVGEDVVALSREEIEFLCAMGREEQIVEMSVGIMEGSRVRVLEGPLQGREGLICRVDRHRRRAYLEIEMFGRKLQTQVGLEIVEKATS